MKHSAGTTRAAIAVLAPALLYLASVVEAVAAQSPTGRILLEPRQDTYYVGQNVRLVVELEFSDGELAGGLQFAGMPGAPWARLGEFEPLAGATRTENGRLVNKRRFSADLLLLKEGEHQVAPMLGGMLEEQSRTGWSSVVMQRSFRVRTPPVTIVVAGLPEPSPAGFCGAVGRFTLRAEVVPGVAAPGDLVTLRWSLEGSGSLNAFQPPSLPAPPHAKTYAPKVDANDVVRRVEVSQVFVPESLEAALLPELALHVFNPDAARYERLAAGPFPITLRPREAVPAPPGTGVVEHLTPSVASPTARPDAVPAGWRVPPPSVAAPLLVLLGGVALGLTLLVSFAGRSRIVAVLLAAAAMVAAVLLRQALLANDARGSLVLAAVAESRLCPSSSARLLAVLPARATVRVLEHTERWLRVEHEGASGWIPMPEPPK